MTTKAEHICAAIEHLRAAAAASENLTFSPTLLQELEQATALLSIFTTEATHSGVQAHMGQLVGSSKPVDYLTEALSLPRGEAWQRLRRVDFDYGELPEKSATIRRKRLARERELLPPTTTTNMIHSELRWLSAETAQQLYASALEQTPHRRGNDLRTWLRREIHQLTGKSSDPSLSYNRRAVRQRRLSDQLTEWRIISPNAETAMIQALLAPARLPAGDTRTYEQRCFDRFIRCLHSAQPGPLASIVISMSLKDVVGKLPADATFATSTGVELTPAEILRLGITDAGFAVVHHPETGRAIHGEHIRRAASVEQKLMLFAEQLLCSHPECERPANECDAHHIQPWASGGKTETENLALVCRPHHVNNDNTHTHRNGKSFYDIDPDTGRKGLRRATGAISFNNTIKQEKSGGYRVRNQPWPEAPDSG